MAPQHKRPAKSYSRNVLRNRSAANVLHNILTNPIQKKKNRRKPKIEIKELPPLSEQICFTNESDSQLEVNFNSENTFDRLLKGPNYNNVNFKVFRNKSLSESSLSLLHIKKKRSPVKQRRIVHIRKRSPIVTRSISLQNSLLEISANKEDENKKVRTLAMSVNESLFIEKLQVNKQDSTVHFSTSLDNKSNSIQQLRDVAKENSANLSFEPMFSKTFTEKYGNKLSSILLLANAVSSTPIAPILGQRLVNETIISPIVNLDNEKLESNMTPKLRRVSKICRSSLMRSMDYQNSMLHQKGIVENDNEISQNAAQKECSVLNDRNEENTNDNSPEIISNNKEKASNEILSINVEEIIQNDTVKDLSKLFENAVVNVTLLNWKSLGTPFTNLTNIQIGPFRNKFNLNNTENNMLTEISDHKVAVPNVTLIDFERYLYQLNKNVCREVLPKKDDSESQNVTKIYRKPFVDISNININNINQPIDTPGDSGSSSECPDLQTINEPEELHRNIESVDLVKYQPVVNITRINLEESLTSRSQTYNSKEINTKNEQNRKEKRCSNNTTKSSRQSLSNCSEEDYQRMKGASALIKRNQLDSQCQIDLRHSSPFRGFPSQTELSKFNSENNSEFEDVNQFFTTRKNSLSSYITLRRRKIPKVTPNKRPKDRSKTKDVESKSSVTNDFEFSGSVVIVSDEESANFRNISTENHTDLGILSRISDGTSLNGKEMISEDEIHGLTPQIISPDLFKSTSLSTGAQSAINSPENKENYLQSQTNGTVMILEGISANSIDSSTVNTSYVDFTCKGIAGFPFKTGKRSRTSQFKQRTSAHNKQSINNSSLLIDIIENTPINITKRNKISYTPKKSTVTIDLGKSRSRKVKRDLQPAMGQSELNDSATGDCSLKSSTAPKASQTSKKSLKRSNFQPEISETEVSSESFTVPKTSITFKRESKTSLKNSDFQSVIDPSKVNEQPARDSDSNAPVQETPKTSKGESLKIPDLQRVLGESKADDAKANHRGSNIFAVPKLPVFKKGRDPIEDDKIVLKPGKLWRRSLLEVRNGKINVPSDRQSLLYEGGSSCACRKNLIEASTPRRSSIRVVPLANLHDVTNPKSNSDLENYAMSCQKTSCLPLNTLREFSHEGSLGGVALNKEEEIFEMSVEVSFPPQEMITAREVVLRKCGQTEPIPFSKCYTNSILKYCQKIGEGVYGEVFIFRHPTSNLTTVIKIIPIEGDLIINGERQKKFEEVLSEITIAMELSNLRSNSKNTTDCFSELKKVNCVQGKYPKQLLNLWRIYNETNCSENDDPGMFDKDQLYISLELANGGNSMESFVFNNSQQAYSLVTQVACALSVAENSLEFEHRDLHWGNVLVSNTDNDDIAYNLDGKCLNLPSHGIQLAIIDFTLSRISHDGVCLYNDLSVDPDLFTATGDYQFEIYRLMKKHNKNDWQHYQPYTNILWLHYIVDKTINGVKYRNKTSKIHRQYLRQLRELHSSILQYKNVKEFVASTFFEV